MADILLTDKDDDYTVAQGSDWNNIKALAGNDTVTLYAGSTVLGQAGNDTIVDKTGGNFCQAAYWDSPAAIDANLQTGIVKDGWGTVDTLIGIHNLNTSGRNGDKVLGSDQDDQTWVNGFWQSGQAWIDMAGGSDKVTVANTRSSFTLSVSADGRKVDVSRNGYTAHISNAETIEFWTDKGSERLAITDLIDFSKVGVATLLAAADNAWSSGGRAVALTYSFMTAAPKYGGDEGGQGFTTPSEAYQAAVRSILSQLSQSVGLSFSEVSDSDASQLRFASNQQTATKGYSFTAAAANGLKAGDVWMDTDSLVNLTPGSEGWQALLHEIGHALGLVHPTAQSDTSAAVVLLDRWNNNAYTVMSDKQSASALWQSWYGVLDLQALQALYGSAPRTQRSGNDTYTLSDTTGRVLSTVSDAGGHDTVDASTLSQGVYLDLVPGRFSSVGLTSSGNISLDNLFIDSASMIEDAVGTPWDDVLLGNSADNVFSPGLGNNTIDGAEGFNAVRMNARRADYSFSVDSATGHVIMQAKDGASGTSDLFNIHRVAFSDCALALDMGSKGSAVAKILGAVFGKAAINNLDYTGIGMYYMDHGHTAQSLMDLALQVRLGANYSVDSEVRLFYETLVGRAPTSAEVSQFAGMVAQGALTKNSLAWLAANTDFNAENIGLTGLMQTGLDYVPMGGGLV